MNSNHSNLKNDFLNFSKKATISPPPAVRTHFFDSLNKLTTPSLTQVFRNIISIHLLSSVFSLTICPQFGVRLFFQGHGLMSYFMKAGDLWCWVYCGSFYLGTTLILANLLLNSFQWKVLLNHPALMLTGLVLLSVGSFWMISPDLSWKVILPWIIGAYTSTLLPLKVLKFRLNYEKHNS